MKAILAYAFDEARAAFFERFRAGLRERDIELVVVTNRPALLRRYPQARCLARPRRGRGTADDTLIRDSLEYRTGNRDLRSARRLCCSLLECLSTLAGEFDISGVFIWNGSSLPDRIVTRFSREHGIPTAYFENSNIPGRMIVDGLGVNAGCSIAIDPSLLSGYASPLSPEQFAAWSNDYIESNRRSHKVHQAKGVKQVNWSFIGDALAQRLRGIPRYEMYPFLTKTLRKLDAILYRPPSRHLDVFPERFVFLPLQVQSDTQLIFNSDVGNEEALEIVFSRRQPGQEVLVKQHPAEPSKRAQRRYSRIIAQHGGIETSNNTFELMQRAEKVFTINSTAGLQAKLMGKPVECLGRAVFAKMNETDLNRYIHGFLAPIEFFNESPIGVHQVEIILRALNNVSLEPQLVSIGA